MENSLRSVSALELRNDISQFLSEAAFSSTRIVVTRNGKEVAALVPTADLQLLQEIERLIDVEAAKEALKEEGELISLETLKKELL